MNAKKTDKMYPLRLLPLLAMFLSIVLCASVVQAQFPLPDWEGHPPIAIPEGGGIFWLGDVITLNGSSDDPDLVDDPILNWIWFITSSPQGATYTFEDADTQNPVFTGFTLGRYEISLIACDQDGCSQPAETVIILRDPTYTCPLSVTPFVTYELQSDECDLDSDGNGLDDSMELQIAQCFVPEFAFDQGEYWFSLGPEEPHVVFNIALDDIDGDNFHITIRYGVVWAWDAGFVNSSEPWCHNPFGIGEPQVHAGDTQGMKVSAWLKKGEGKASWVAELESISGFAEVTTIPFYREGLGFPVMLRDATHPVVYPSAGKHHFRPYPDDYQFTIECWPDTCTCTENAYGNYEFPYPVPIVQHVPHFPSAPPAATGPQGGPPTLVDQYGRTVWANACNLIKGNPDMPALSLRPDDLSDWTYPYCLIPSPIDCFMLENLPELQFWTYDDPQFPGLTWSISSNLFRSVNGVWMTVMGGLDPDIDADGLDFWDDPCPAVSGNYTDSDSDGLCDPLDICPNDSTNDADGDGFCGSPPTCNSGGPYGVQCSGPNTLITLNGSTSSDPDGFPLTYSWSTDCGGSFDDSGSATPVLTVDSSSGCSISCNVFLTVTDADGAAVDCVAPVTVTDTQGPDIACAADQTRECSDSTDPLYTGYASASDTCDSSPTMNYASGITAGSCPNEWTINRTWTASDDCGNANSCNQVITVVDSTPPDIVCPPDVTIECEEATDPSNTGVASAVDNCSGTPSISYQDEMAADPSCPSVGIITRTWTADDACGNTSSCSQMITLEDTKGPVIACNAPAAIIPPDAPVSFSAAAEDNCDTDPHIEITGYDCFTHTQKGKRISKLESCMVSIDNNMLTVLDSGGVDTTITWGVLAADCADNQSTAECAVTIINPSQ